MASKKIPDNDRLKTVAIIPGAGTGARMGTDKAKQFMKLNGKPIIALTLEKFQRCSSIQSIILVVPPTYVTFCKREIVEKYRLNKVEKIIAGGERRQDSVRLGIEATKGRYGLVLIHDGVRPFVKMNLIEEALEAARKDRAVITALPVKDTPKKVDKGGFILKTYKRELLWLAQTPQVFWYEDILSAHRKALSEGWDQVTDDAFLIEKMGIPVKVILGSEYNIKITTPNDMEIGKYLLAKGKKDIETDCHVNR